MKSVTQAKGVVLILLAFIASLSSGCLGPKKINKWVATHYEGHIPAPSKKKNEQIVILSNIAGQASTISTTEKETRNLLPLIVYWEFDYRNTCTLNPQIPINNFTSTVMSYSAKGFKQKLKDERLELTLEQIPGPFVIDDKGHMVLIIVSWEYVAVIPVKKDLVVSYRLLNSNNEEVKKGTISISDPNKAIPIPMFTSLKKKTWEYLDQYDANITSMSKQLMDQLMTEL